MKNGLTMVGLLIIITIILLVGGVGSNFLGRGCDQRFSPEQNAKGELYMFAKKLNWDVQAVICEGTDFDNDGYISCVARVFEQSNGRIVEKHVKCASGSSTIPISGCKIMMNP